MLLIDFWFRIEIVKPQFKHKHTHTHTHTLSLSHTNTEHSIGHLPQECIKDKIIIVFHLLSQLIWLKVTHSTVFCARVVPRIFFCTTNHNFLNKLYTTRNYRSAGLSSSLWTVFPLCSASLKQSEWSTFHWADTRMWCVCNTTQGVQTCLNHLRWPWKALYAGKGELLE